MSGNRLYHDLNQPLVSMLGFVQILRRDWSRLNDEDRDRLLAIVEEEGLRMSEMLSALAVSEIDGETGAEPSNR